MALTLPPSLAQGLQGYWHFENSLYDVSPNKYHLTPHGGLTFTKQLFGKGLNLVRASSQYADIANASCPNLEITGSCTWMAWIKPATVSGADFHIMAKDKAASSVFRQFYINSASTIIFQCEGLTTNTFVQSTNTLSGGVTYMVVGVYDSVAQKLRLFVYTTSALFETKEVTASGSMTASDQPFCIGKNNANAYFDGQIDEVIVWNRALSNTEVTSLFNNYKKFYSYSMGRRSLVV